MKNTAKSMAFILSMILSWLLFSIIWDFFDTNHTYVEVLRRPEQFIGLLSLYWWFPGVFILADMD